MSGFRNAALMRRSRYAFGGPMPISDEQVQDIVNFAILNSPTPYNNQTSRAVLLFGEQHAKLWDIVKSTLKKSISPEAFAKTEKKIDASFLSGHGTIMFFEDQGIVKAMQAKFPNYADNFPLWSTQASGMLQYNVWTMLAEAGVGASLQHYNPVIDKEVAREWNIDPEWRLMSQMPFGRATDALSEKSFEPLEKRVLIYK